MKITIDLQQISKDIGAVVERAKKETDYAISWGDTLLDVLEERYGLETKLNDYPEAKALAGAQ